jgi:hypothetical protein
MNKPKLMIRITVLTGLTTIPAVATITRPMLILAGVNVASFKLFMMPFGYPHWQNALPVHLAPTPILTYAA